MRVTDDLIEARKIIENPEHWTQGVFARDAKGHPTNMCDETAVCFCISGAIARAVNKDAYRWQNALNALSRHIKGTRHIADFNDSRTHAEVLAAFDAAISAARAI